jgi:soluble lytic murein transglycosylase-like protein
MLEAVVSFAISQSVLFHKIEKVSQEYKVSEGLITYIVKNESQFDPYAVGDRHITCPMTGEKMRSRGLVQISDCYWPEITDEMAHDPDFALKFLAEKLSEGKCELWTTCRRYQKLFV